PLSLGDLRTENMPELVIDAHDRVFREHRDIPYAPVPGEPNLRDVVAANMRGRFGVDAITSEHVLPIPGSRFGEFAFLDIFYRSFPDKSVLIVDPCWATGPQQALYTGGSERLIEMMLPYDPRTLFARLTPTMLSQVLEDYPEIGAVFLTNPNNPTGQLMTGDEMAGFARIIAKHRVFVLEDMTYGYVTFGHGAPSLQKAAQTLSEPDKKTLLERVVTILGLQKLVGSGFRVSAIATQNLDILRSMTGLLSFTSGPVNKPAQAAAAAYYSNDCGIVGANADLKQRRLVLARSLEQARVRLHERHGAEVIEHTLGPVVLDEHAHGGGYYAVLRLNERAVSRVCETMGAESMSAGVVMEFFAREVGATIQPGATMRLNNNHLRLAFGAAHTHQIELLSDRLTHALG
ncbi:MAG: pyridoxal phosphate-dependent aminotransferase, partial [Candidatus Micrarchaeota archaeon]